MAINVYLSSAMRSSALHTANLRGARRIPHRGDQSTATTLRSISSVTAAHSVPPSLLVRARPTLAKASNCLRVTQARFQSQSTSSTSPTSTTMPKSTTNQSTSTIRKANSPPPLTWPTFLHLRTQRRRLNLAASVLAGGATMAAGASALVTQDPVQLSALLFNLDPVVTMGMCTLACGAAGWLAGPLVGAVVFRAGGWGGEGFREMERNFYQRIKKHRVDPSSTSYANPVPDYYGERISSVAGYRRWLKDQRAFTRKRQRV